MVPGRVQNVQLVDAPADAVELPVEVLDGRRVLLVHARAQKARDDGRLAHLAGAQDHHPAAVLGRDVEPVLGGGHLPDHGPSACLRDAEFRVGRDLRRAAFTGQMAAPPACVTEPRTRPGSWSPAETRTMVPPPPGRDINS